MTDSACLAYVFWHWMRADGSVSAYEDALTAFQRTLRDNAPAGYRHAAVYRHGAAPWLAGSGACYVDWYIVDGSAAMDPLNDAAVSAACLAAHDAAADGAAGGTAGLYGLRRGRVSARDVRAATWFCKPAGMPYADLDENMAAQAGSGPWALFGRRMTLGPTPELCLLAPEKLSLPDEFGAVHASMELVWPRDGDSNLRRDSEVPLH